MGRNSVKKTAQWAVFSNSPEGFSLRDRGARSAARNPGGPAIFPTLLRRSNERRFFVRGVLMLRSNSQKNFLINRKMF